MYIKYIHGSKLRAPADATILCLWLVHILLHHNITVTDTSRTDPWWVFIKQVWVLSEMYTRSLETQPKLTFTFHACFI